MVFTPPADMIMADIWEVFMPPVREAICHSLNNSPAREMEITQGVLGLMQVKKVYDRLCDTTPSGSSYTDQWDKDLRRMLCDRIQLAVEAYNIGVSHEKAEANLG